MLIRVILVLTILAAVLGCTEQRAYAAPDPVEGEQIAVFAGGCFWCMEPPFEGRPGIRAVVSGYTGGPEEKPTYKQVSSGKTGHTEAVQVIYDPKQISYEQLLKIFWRTFDPTDGGGQFADRGSQYRPGIFPANAKQRELAEASLKALATSGKFKKPIAVEITDFGTFWPAEEYHQDYYKKNPGHYKRYRRGSGRVQFLTLAWDEKTGWGHPEIEGVPNAVEDDEKPAKAKPEPTSQPTSRPTK